MCVSAIFGKPKLPKPVIAGPAPQRDDDAIRRREQLALQESAAAGGRLSTFVSGLAPTAMAAPARKVLLGAS